MTGENLATRIRHVMQQEGLTQKDLAALLHISQPAVSLYLKGRMPPADTLKKRSCCNSGRNYQKKSGRMCLPCCSTLQNGLTNRKTGNMFIAGCPRIFYTFQIQNR
ncbi:hypothetical protein B1H10_07425 [candidate division KSB1 bacterium 4484_188]|nr:MAG: hypothetical protein B1H10_07425 [candidate division KSB1 bacterium 4484_188]